MAARVNLAGVYHRLRFFPYSYRAKPDNEDNNLSNMMLWDNTLAIIFTENKCIRVNLRGFFGYFSWISVFLHTIVSTQQTVGLLLLLNKLNDREAAVYRAKKFRQCTGVKNIFFDASSKETYLQPSSLSSHH